MSLRGNSNPAGEASSPGDFADLWVTSPYQGRGRGRLTAGIRQAHGLTATDSLDGRADGQTDAARTFQACIGGMDVAIKVIGAGLILIVKYGSHTVLQYGHAK